MIRLWLAVAGLGGAASIIAGALAAHLADDPRTQSLLRTGALYGMVHAVALIAVIGLAQGREPRRGAAALAGLCFALEDETASSISRNPSIRRHGCPHGK